MILASSGKDNPRDLHNIPRISVIRKEPMFSKPNIPCETTLCGVKGLPIQLNRKGKMRKLDSHQYPVDIQQLCIELYFMDTLG